MTGSRDAICQWLRHELTCKHHVNANSMRLSPAAVCPPHRHCVLRFAFVARVPVSSHLSCVFGSVFPRALRALSSALFGFFQATVDRACLFNSWIPMPSSPSLQPGWLSLSLRLDHFLLRPIRSDGGTWLWWVCLWVNTDYRHWVSDLRSPPVSG